MTGIQILLVTAALLWLVNSLARLRAPGVPRLLAILVTLAAVILVLFPNISTRLAHLVGVTRGVDLVFYVSFVVFAFLWLHQATRLRLLEEKLVELTRRLALEGRSDEPGRESP